MISLSEIAHESARIRRIRERHDLCQPLLIEEIQDVITWLHATKTLISVQGNEYGLIKRDLTAQIEEWERKLAFRR